MAGYNGYKMSNNAVEAYYEGEKPESKWTKTEIIDAIIKDVDKKIISINFDMKLLKKVKLSTLRLHFLKCTGWHHTSNYYNKTEFFKIDSSFANKLTNEYINDMIEYNNKEKKALLEEKNKKEIWKCRFLTWSGTRNHPKAEEHEEVCEIVGNWAITTFGRKSIYANGFEFLMEVK